MYNNEYPQAVQGGGMSWGNKNDLMERQGYGRFRRPGKQEIINWFKTYMGAQELDLVDDTYDNQARHICLGSTSVDLLQKQMYTLNFPDGNIVLEYYACKKCGKIILNRNFM